jgi:SAM-dependent methyltransferase
MHDTSLIIGAMFAKTYAHKNMTVVDIGGSDVNGSLRPFYKHLKYICVDLTAHPSVDIVVKPYERLPFETGSIDMVISTSCFEHDPCFWITFKEMCRVVKLGGHIYVNAPANGAAHNFPGDNWRFYPDAAQALAYWSGKCMSNEEVHPVKVVETFHVMPKADIWKDFVGVWQRVVQKETDICTAQNIINTVGPLEKVLIEQGLVICKHNVSTV